jgi:hypothetical protein
MSEAKKLAYIITLYYGWIIVAVALVSMAFWLGIRSSFSIFLSPCQKIFLGIAVNRPGFNPWPLSPILSWLPC